MAMEITQFLLSAQSADANLRTEAENNLRLFQEQNLPVFLLSLSAELSNNEKPIESRRLAGIVLKNSLDAKDAARKEHLIQQWMAIEISVKSQIKDMLLKTLGSSATEARHTSAQVVAKIAGIEIPRKSWPELIGSLLVNMTQQDRPAALKQATLETLGYVCEEISHEDLGQDEVNSVLTAVVQGMNLPEHGPEVRLSATRALYNALDFAQTNFENEMERNYIMKVVCETAMSNVLEIRQAAFECLVSIASTYYDVLQPYMQTLFELTSNAVKGDEETVALQAIEFWSSICDEEIELQEYEAAESGDSDSPHSHFIEKALSSLVPMLLEALLKQEEDQDQDDSIWNLSMAAGTCLGLVARTVGDAIVPLVMPFVEDKILKPDWHCREAATYAFGSILEGPTVEKLSPLVNAGLDFLLNAMKDENSHVKDTTAWTLGRIFEFLHSPATGFSVISPANLQRVLGVLLESIKDSPNVAEKVCGAIYYLAQGYEDAGSSSSLLSQYLPSIISGLITTAERTDGGDSKLRSSAYETLNEVVRCSNITETSHIIAQLLPVVVNKLGQTLELQIISSDDREKQGDVQALLCGVLQVIIQKFSGSDDTKPIILQAADQIMILFLKVFVELGEVGWIRDELERMRVFLRVAADMEDDDEEFKVWVKQVRDVAYDTEDALDDFMYRLAHNPGEGIRFAAHKAFCSVKNLRARHQMASKIRSIKSRINTISDGHQRYRCKFDMVGQEISNSFSGICGWYDSRGDALLIEEAKLVGIDKPKGQLIRWLLEGKSGLNVVSVVGMGGLGKTTLVKKVYDSAQVKKHFQAHAWINVSQLFNLEELLKDIMRQLFIEISQPIPEGVESMNSNQLKAIINEFLRERRYVIVLDDVWSINNWDAFKYALPNSGCGSRVLITTRIEEVAFGAGIDTQGHAYTLKPLSLQESWILFCRKTFQKDSCPPHLVKLSRRILKRCEGLPLAIVVISGVLATKDSRIDEWEMINRSLGVELATNDRFKSINKILSLSYSDLPYYLKSCFLYLSIFPEDYLIERMRLIRLWIAQGFVEEKQGKTVEEVSNGYLNELLNRSLIQVARTTTDGRIKLCRIHDLMREIILAKSKDQNFVAIANEQNTSWPEKVRCLSIHNSFENVQQSKRVTQLRSLVMFRVTGSFFNSSIFAIFGTDLKLLNSLDLRGAPLEVFPEEIVELFHLKYLSLRDTKVRRLPNSIGKLRNLETLDLKRAPITELPIEILNLQRLRHLLLYHYDESFKAGFPPSINGFEAPSGIGGLSSLQRLNHVEANHDGSLVREIGTLSQLRSLGIVKLTRKYGEALCSSIEKLCNLRSLSLESIEEEEILDLQSLSSPPQFLRSLELGGRLEKLPYWLPSVHSLVKVILRQSRLNKDPLESLGALPNLVELGLFQAYDGETLCFKAGGFQRLKVLWLRTLQGLRMVRVEAGAMPNLERLCIWSCKMLQRVPSGIVYLTNLNYLSFYDMPDELMKTLKPNKRAGDYWKISHISNVYIGYIRNGCLTGYRL